MFVPVVYSRRWMSQGGCKNNSNSQTTKTVKCQADLDTENRSRKMKSENKVERRQENNRLVESQFHINTGKRGYGDKRKENNDDE